MDGMQAGFLERRGAAFVRQESVREDLDGGALAADAGDQLLQIITQERLAAGERDVADAQVEALGDHPAQLVDRQRRSLPLARGDPMHVCVPRPSAGRRLGRACRGPPVHRCTPGAAVAARALAGIGDGDGDRHRRRHAQERAAQERLHDPPIRRARRRRHVERMYVAAVGGGDRRDAVQKAEEEVQQGPLRERGAGGRAYPDAAAPGGHRSPQAGELQRRAEVAGLMSRHGAHSTSPCRRG